MKGVKWTDYQIEYLKKHYGKQKTTTIAKYLRKTRWQVEYRARKLGLMKTNRSRRLPVHLIPIIEEGKKRGLIKND
ncbi:hypothetical protein DRO97_02765 [Archaeoglobales archaeon]|nr:MAG: hypothetical protein DRO97_02765 [Archaeoglobales archaeon]